MCLAVPLKIVARSGPCTAVVSDGTLEMATSVELVPEVAVGEYVLVHAGYAIQVMREDEALDTMEMLREVAGTLPQNM